MVRLVDCGSLLLSGRYGDAHGADAFDAGLEGVPGLDLAYAFRRAGEDYVTGVQRIEAGRPFDQRRHTEDKIFRVRRLTRARFAVDRQRERQSARWLRRRLRLGESPPDTDAER